MTDLQNERLLRALHREPVDRTPVWIMRQAGRYLPEYRRVRAQAGSFMGLCRNAELACEVTLQPLERYPLDAAILFSDILTVPDAMGLGLYFAEGEGPRFEQPVRSLRDITNLPQPDVTRELRYVMDAITLSRRELAGRAPLIGFSGSPWTLATYMVEGGSSRDFRRIKTLLYEHPQVLHHLLDQIALTVVDYLNAQIEAGAQALMIFDTWGGALAHEAYLEFSLDPMRRVIEVLHRNTADGHIPVILFTKGGGLWLEKLAKVGADAISLDWSVNLAAARQQVGERVALQGNLDPCVLYSKPTVIRREVEHVLEAYGPHPGHIFNLGHGIHPEMDPEHVSVMVEAVHEISSAIHDPARGQ